MRKKNVMNNIYRDGSYDQFEASFHAKLVQNNLIDRWYGVDKAICR
jgi:hypothetical protein